MRFTCTVYRSVVSAEGEARKRRAIRSGKTGDIFMDNLSESGWEAIESGSGIDGRQRPKEDVETDGSTTPLKKKRSKRADKEIKCFSTRPAESFEVLNVRSRKLFS
jgi:NAD+ kinase